MAPANQHPTATNCDFELVNPSDANFDDRVFELIDQGLELYGGGDLEGAMSAWKHALVLDGDNQRAADYVAYVKRHFAVTDEQASEGEAFSASDAELDIPFGLVTIGPHSDGAIDSYESFEVGDEGSSKDEPAEPENPALAEFAEEIPTRVKNVATSDVDEGWSLEFDERAGTGTNIPLIASRSDIPDEADRVDEPMIVAADESEDDDPPAVELKVEPSLYEDFGDLLGEPDEPEDGLDEISMSVGEPGPFQSDDLSLANEMQDDQSTTDSLGGALDSVAADLESLEVELENKAEIGHQGRDRQDRHLAQAIEPAERESMTSEIIELVAEPSSPIELESLEDDLSYELDLDDGQHASRPTAEISPLELSDALQALELDQPLGSEPLEGIGNQVPDGESSANAPLEFASQAYASVSILDEDLVLPELPASLGDVQISYREPVAAQIVEVELPGGDLEVQLSALEREMTGSKPVEWSAHTALTKPAAAVGEGLPGSIELGGAGAFAPAQASAQIKPLADREPQVSEASLVEAKPSNRATRKSIPPEQGGLDGNRAVVLGIIDANANPDETVDERIRRRVGGLIELAETRASEGEFQLAAVAADMALDEEPDSAIGQKLIHERSKQLVSVFRRFLGDLSGIVAVAMPLHELSLHELDHRTAFLLSRVDGTLCLEDVLDVSGMPRLEAYRYLARLVLQGILEIR